MSTGRVVTREEFEQAFRKVPGMPTEIIKMYGNQYSRASVAAQRVLPMVRELGFFASRTEKIDAFQLICCGLDDCVDEDIVTQEETLATLFILFFSNDSFAKAMKAFRDFAHGKNLGPGQLASYTASFYAQTC